MPVMVCVLFWVCMWGRDAPGCLRTHSQPCGPVEGALMSSHTWFMEVVTTPMKSVRRTQEPMMMKATK